MKRFIILAITLVFITIGNQMTAQVQTKEKVAIAQKTTLNYLLWLPTGYTKEKSKTYPLLIFLHGTGERGDSLDLVKKNGPPSFLDKRPDFPFITVSPQCPGSTKWMWIVDELQLMLEQLQLKYRIDPERIYLTGLSMGGFGTWAWACSRPGQFAAIAPVCGGGYIHYSYELKNTPVWAFHGDADDVVPVKCSIEMVEAVNAVGGSARLTVYPGVGHDSWVNAYQDEELFKWLLAHTRQKEKVN